MTNSLLIGKTIYNILSANAELTAMVESKIYPLIAEQSTTYPFVIYYRENISVNRVSKDGYGEDEVNFTVVCVSDNYSQSVDIANTVRKALEKQKINGQDITITNSCLTSVDESWNDNAYVQRLNFKCTVN